MKDEIKYAETKAGGPFYIKVSKDLPYKEGDIVSVHIAFGITDHDKVLGKLVFEDEFGRFYHIKGNPF